MGEGVNMLKNVFCVVIGAVVGAGAALVYTRPFSKKADVAISPAVFGDQGAGLHVAMRF